MKKLLLLAMLSVSVFANENTVEIKLDKSKSVTTKVEALYYSTNSLCKEIGNGPIMPRIQAKTLTKVSDFSGDIKVETKLDTFCKYKLDSLVLTFKHKGKLAYNSTYIANYTNRVETQTYDVDCSYETASKLVCNSSAIINFDFNNSAEIRVNID